MDWTDLVLRLLAIVGVGWFLWQGFRRTQKRIVHAGRRYYRQPDGSFRTIWGRRVTDPAVLAALERVAAMRLDTPDERQGS